MDQQLLTTLQNIQYNQEEILKKLNVIENRLMILENSSTKMDNHIDFVENVYDKVKTPFHYVMDNLTKIKQLKNN